MNRRTLPQLGRVIAATALSVVALSATTVKQIHPPAGGTNAPVRIAILADHYTTTQEQEFNYDVANFIKYGLLADDFYKDHASSMHIASYFDATPTGQESRFGFALGPGDGNCAVKAPGDILSKLLGAIGAGTVLPSHYVVIGNHPYEIGCTSGNWSYVAVDAIGTDVFEHELGHLIGLLFDEWAMPSYGSASHPGLISDLYNCAPKPATPPPPGPPYWLSNPTKFPGAQVLSDCDLYKGGVVHAYDHCRMGAMHHRAFCYVCKEAMTKGFAYVTSTPPPIDTPQPQASHPPTASSRFRIVNASFTTTAAAAVQEPTNPPRPVMRVVVEFDPGSRVPPQRAAKFEVRDKVFAMGVYVPNHRRMGEFLYEISDNSGSREIGVIPDSMFRSRAFQGGGPHGTSAPRPVQMFVDVPNEDAKSAADGSRNLKIVMYRIPSGLTAPIVTKEIWEKFRSSAEKVAEVPLTGPPAK